MITEPEYRAVKALRDMYTAHLLMAEVCGITSDLLDGRDPAALQSMRLAARESGIHIDDALVPEFADDIISLLGDRESAGA